ncbi:MAG: nucleotide exchange factor GrpE [Bdellovibrionota bacterium]
MTEKETTDAKAHAHDDCCGGGHCEDNTADRESLIDDAPEEVTQASQAEEVDWKVQAAYLGAEIENMQKRFLREASEIRKYSNEDLLKKIVPVLDTLLLALNAAAKAKTQPENEALFSSKVYQSFIQGVELTAKQFEQVLETCGVEFIEAKDQVFDPTLHEALGQSKVEGVEDNIITEEFQRGFKLGSRVVRPAKVIVNKK